MKVDAGEIKAAFKVIRANADDSGYGSWISDENCMTVAKGVVEAITEYRAEKKED